MFCHTLGNLPGSQPGQQLWDQSEQPADKKDGVKLVNVGVQGGATIGHPVDVAEAITRINKVRVD